MNSLNSLSFEDCRSFIGQSNIEEGVKEALIRTLEESMAHEKALSALMAGSKAVLGEKFFKDSARAIFDHCKKLIGATFGYVALLSEDGVEKARFYFWRPAGCPAM